MGHWGDGNVSKTAMQHWDGGVVGQLVYQGNWRKAWYIVSRVSRLVRVSRVVRVVSVSRVSRVSRAGRVGKVSRVSW